MNCKVFGLGLWLCLALLSNGRTQQWMGRVDSLTEALKDGDANVRTSAAWALGNIGPEAKSAIPHLTEALKDGDANVRTSATWALGNIGPEAKSAIPHLIEALKDGDANVRTSAAWALGNIGPEAKSAMPHLIEALKDGDRWVRSSAANTIGKISEKLQDIRDTDAVPQLEKALSALVKAGEHGGVYPVKRSIEALKHKKRLREQLLINLPLKWIAENNKGLIGAFCVLTLWSFWFVLSRWQPLWILQINNALRPYLDFKFPDVFGGMNVSLRYVLLVGFFNYGTRVLDAWVTKQIDEGAREVFQDKPTVKDCAVRIAVPVFYGDEIVTNLSPSLLKTAFSKKRRCLLIWGEGGSGKTSLACQLARWAMSPDKSERLYEGHLMLPVLIEEDLEIPVTDAKHPYTPLMMAIRSELGTLVKSENPIPEEFLIHLLRRRRVLVIIDHFSELSEATQKAIQLHHPDFPVNALVVTSRIEEELGGVPSITLRTQPLDGSRLSLFIEGYLTQRRKRELFDDPEYFDACRQLSSMVGQRDITVFLAKLYADQMIAMKEGLADVRLPKDIPELMLYYLNGVNRNVTENKLDEGVVHRSAKIVAWECLKKTYRPISAKRNEMLAALDSNGGAENLLNYLEDGLQLVQSIGAAKDRIRFRQASLAEYLAGLYLVKQHNSNEKGWQNLLDQADALTDTLESVRGFLLAVRDCCMTQDASEVKVPDWLPDKLGKRAGQTLEALKQAQLKQRINLLVGNPNSTNAKDWNSPKVTLRKIGPEGKSAVPHLIEVLKYKNGYARISAAQTLRSIGLEAMPALIEALKDGDRYVRSFVAQALGHIGPEAKFAVPHLIEALKDDDATVRSSAAQALGHIGPKAKTAVPHLIEALKDKDGYIRISAAQAIGNIGPAVIPALIEALKDKDGCIRISAAQALGHIGPEAKSAVPTLIEALKDKDGYIRISATQALGHIGPKAKSAVPHLMEALKDQNGSVRYSAEEALRKINKQ